MIIISHFLQIHFVSFFISDRFDLFAFPLDPYRLDEGDDLADAVDALRRLAHDLDDPIGALRCQVGENLDAGSGLLQKKRKRERQFDGKCLRF